MATNPRPRPHALSSDLPSALQREGAISLDVEEGVVILRASKAVASRIQSLLEKSAGGLTDEERNELDQFEELDDYLSLLNRLSRNLIGSESSALRL